MNNNNNKTSNNNYCFIQQVLGYLHSNIKNNSDLYETQLFIEEFIFNNNVGKVTNQVLLGGVDPRAFNTKILNYINDNISLDQYVVKVFEMDITTLKKDDHKLMYIMIHTIGKEDFKGKCYSILFWLLTYIHEDFSPEEESKINLMSIIDKIGKSIIRSFFSKLVLKYNKGKKSNKLTYTESRNKWIDENSVYKDIINDVSFSGILGGVVIEVLEKSQLIDRKYFFSNNKNFQYVTLTNKDFYLKCLNYKPKLQFLSTHLPMLVKPKDYTFKSLGGYLYNDIKFSEDLFIKSPIHTHQTNVDKNGMFYNNLNKINSVGFKINNDLFNFLVEYSHKLLLSSEHPFDGKDLKTLSKKELKDYKGYKSKVLSQEVVMEIASFYKDFDVIYLPVKIDFRGRLNCVPAFFNYQSSELSRALLLFSSGGIIHKGDLDSIKYIKVYGANSFGNDLDKKAIKGKVEWVDNNHYDIINFKNFKLLNKAENKLLFLAFCLEYKRLNNFLNNEDSREFKTYLPIQLDATCNGFQHLALLSNENSLFNVLNLTNNSKVGDELEPNDFYNFLMFKLKNFINQELSIEDSDLQNQKNKDDLKASYIRINKFNWLRKTYKSILMPLSYNITEYTMKKNLISTLSYKMVNDDILYYNDDDELNWINTYDINNFVSIIHKNVLNEFQKMKRLTKYISNVARMFNQLELPITWSVPSGLSIIQSYLQTKTTTISPFTFSRSKINVTKGIPKKYNKKKQVRSFMPNLVHSLDSSSLMLLFDQFYKIYKKDNNIQFYSIHDCFATTADKVNNLKFILASVYTDLYINNNYLIYFDENLYKTLKDNKIIFDKDKRLVNVNKGIYELHDISWVLGDKQLTNKQIKAIDSQNILNWKCSF